MSVAISAIVAMSENRVIGRDNDLPWHIPEDLKRFKALTMGKPIIMGRKTFQSIVSRLGKPLPGRTNIVVSRGGFPYDGVDVFSDLKDAIEKAKQEAESQGLDEIFIGGGAQIYELSMPYIERLYLTIIHQKLDGDAYFPVIDMANWKIIQEKQHHGSEQQPAYTFRNLERQV